MDGVSSQASRWWMCLVNFDGSFHEVDSSEIAFKLAAGMALQEAVTFIRVPSSNQS